MWKTSSDASRIRSAEPLDPVTVDPEPLDEPVPVRPAPASEATEVLQAVAQLDRASRQALLDVLSSEDAAFRGRAIRALYRSDPTRGLAELLIDCEVEPDVRSLLLVLLRELERG
jgi:hypothetical protein